MKNLDLGKEKIGKLLWAFALPCVISMLINSVYNIVDQIFIGKGVGTLGNAATNVIFPIVIICNALAGLIGNGAAASLSLRLGEKNYEEAKKNVGTAVFSIFIIAIVFTLFAYIALPKLVYFFGCTDNVYEYAMTYGRIILIGAPFMIVYTGLSSLIRADGSPKYSMILLVIGAIINLILDPIFIFGFNMGVAGGAFATIIGQIVSFILAIIYLPKMKSVKLEKKDYMPNKSITRILGLGLSSFITQMTILALFVFMNNILTKYGAGTKYGADIPLSVYGVISKLNSLYVSAVLGISIGAQPIIGYNYGAGNYKRVKEVLLKVLKINFIIGIIFNLVFFLFPEQIVDIFVMSTDANYKIFMEFAVFTCRTFLMVCFLNALEMTTSIVIQSLGNVKKATAVSFIRQIVLFIPIALILCITLNQGIRGVLYAGPIADVISFIVCIGIFLSEYRKIGKYADKKVENSKSEIHNMVEGNRVVITISREYGSGGHYVGELLAQSLGIPCYDKELIQLASKESGLSESYVASKEEAMDSYRYENNNDDRLFIAETNVIRKLAKNSCVIVGRCADYILKDEKDVLHVFLYADDEQKVNRAVKYYGMSEKTALKQIRKINKDRARHYQYYTNRKWQEFQNYDLILNVDSLGIEKTVDYLKKIVLDKNN